MGQRLGAKAGASLCSADSQFTTREAAGLLAAALTEVRRPATRETTWTKKTTPARSTNRGDFLFGSKVEAFENRHVMRPPE